MGMDLAAKLEVKALQLSSRCVTELVLVTAAKDCSALCGANLKRSIPCEWVWECKLT
jgi:hypothetical protein